MTDEEIRQRNERAIRALDSLDDIGDEEEQRATLEALIKGLDEDGDRMSDRKRFRCMRLVFLDTGILGMVSNPRGKPKALQCRQWARDLLSAGVRVFVPEVCDYKERRKLIHNGPTSGLIRLDRLKDWLDYAPITTDVMHRAAELWAQARSRGTPTSGPRALDADSILAAQALLSAGPADIVTIASPGRRS